MSIEELIEKLNAVPQYEIEECGRNYESYRDLVQSNPLYGGEWVKVEDIAKALGLSVSWNGNKFQSS